MIAKIVYSKTQLEAAVLLIGERNPKFIGQFDYIRNTILNMMKDIALDPHSANRGTMGFMLWGDKYHEGFDYDMTYCHFYIDVDPAVGRDYTEVKIQEIVSDGN